MGENKDISIIISCSDDEKQLEKLDNIKVRIIIKILREKYGEKILEQYISSIKKDKNNYS